MQPIRRKTGPPLARYHQNTENAKAGIEKMKDRDWEDVHVGSRALSIGL